MTRMLRSGLIAAISALMLAPAAVAQQPTNGFAFTASDTPPVPVEPRVALLRGLEKVTARVREIEAPVGQPIRLGRLEITVRYCEARPPEETPETTAFVDIDDHTLSGDVVRVFSGWMFASAPALNALEHPVYDVWVMNCRALAPGRETGNR